MTYKSPSLSNLFKRRHRQEENQKEHISLALINAHQKVYSSRCRVYWPDIKPLEPGFYDSILQPVNGLVHIKRLGPVFFPQQQSQPIMSVSMIIGCKAVARLVWRRRRMRRCGGSVVAAMTDIPTLVIGVAFDSMPHSKQGASLCDPQPLMEIFEAVRDALMGKGITEYGLEVTLLDLLPAAVETPGDGLLGQVTCVLYQEQSM